VLSCLSATARGVSSTRPFQMTPQVSIGAGNACANGPTQPYSVQFITSEAMLFLSHAGTPPKAISSISLAGVDAPVFGNEDDDDDDDETDISDR
jgi:hypothetical protein